MANEHKNTSPEGPKRGPKGAKKGSEVDLDASSLKNAQSLEFTSIYMELFMSELPKSTAITAKIAPSDNIFANLQAS